MGQGKSKKNLWSFKYQEAHRKKTFRRANKSSSGGEVQIKKLLSNNPPEFGFTNLPVARGVRRCLHRRIIQRARLRDLRLGRENILKPLWRILRRVLSFPTPNRLLILFVALRCGLQAFRGWKIQQLSSRYCRECARAVLNCIRQPAKKMRRERAPRPPLLAAANNKTLFIARFGFAALCIISAI